MSPVETVSSSSAGRLALLPQRARSDVVAWRCGVPVTLAEFEADVQAVAAHLPAVGYVMNMCVSRYTFAVVWVASMARSIVNLFPNNASPEHLSALLAEHPNQVCVGDEPDYPRPHGAASLAYDALVSVQPGEELPALPQSVVHELVVARIYTSGSTGLPQGHDKRFGPVLASVRCAARRLWVASDGAPCAVVGTSSFRHMYGLESTVLLPLYGGGVMSDRQPFFPDDIVQALAELPPPRMLVTTPFHLRKLLEHGGNWPVLSAVVSATAPLAAEVAHQTEEQLGAQVLEVYGSTESGQIATRRTVAGSAWHLLDGLTLSASDKGEELTRWRVAGPSQWEPQWLNDVLESIDDEHFQLVDRMANLINIVGKRTTLSYLNHLLTTVVPGVVDGVYCVPPDFNDRDNARLLAFVVAPGLTVASVHAALRQHLDAVFLPRPVVFIDHLPRDANGKVLASALSELISQHVRST